MRLIPGMAAAVLTASFGVTAQAQLIGSVTASPTTVQAGEPVTVTANVEVLSGNYCGFAVFYGDSKNIESYSDVNHPTPFVTTHVYAKPGSYTISMGGRNVASHTNCGGNNTSASVTVTEAVRPTVATPAQTGGSGAMAKTSATSVCKAAWKLSGNCNAKTGAYTCTAKAGRALPDPHSRCVPVI
jgi:hypothetical protein